VRHEGTVRRISGARADLASDESRWTNGAHFVVDGGNTVNDV
jgi:hypothetical protein